MPIIEVFYTVNLLLDIGRLGLIEPAMSRRGQSNNRNSARTTQQDDLSEDLAQLSINSQSNQQRYPQRSSAAQAQPAAHSNRFDRSNLDRPNSASRTAASDHQSVTPNRSQDSTFTRSPSNSNRTQITNRTPPNHRQNALQPAGHINRNIRANHYVCDFCHRGDHKPELAYCKQFKAKRNRLNDGLYILENDNQFDSHQWDGFTSSFLVLYAPDGSSESQSSQSPSNQSSFFGGLPVVSFLFGQEGRKLTHPRYQHDALYQEWPVSTGWVGGKRHQYGENPVDCALRELNEEIGSVLQTANVSIDQLKQIVIEQLETRKVLAHVMYQSGITMFVQIPTEMMTRLGAAAGSFVPKEPESGTWESIQGVVIWSEATLLPHLDPLKSKSTPPAFNGGVGSRRDFAPFCAAAMIELEKQVILQKGLPALKNLTSAMTPVSI